MKTQTDTHTLNQSLEKHSLTYSVTHSSEHLRTKSLDQTRTPFSEPMSAVLQICSLVKTWRFSPRSLDVQPWSAIRPAAPLRTWTSTGPPPACATTCKSDNYTVIFLSACRVDQVATAVPNLFWAVTPFWHQRFLATPESFFYLEMFF